ARCPPSARRAWQRRSCRCRPCLPSVRRRPAPHAWASARVPDGAPGVRRKTPTAAGPRWTSRGSVLRLAGQGAERRLLALGEVALLGKPGFEQALRLLVDGAVHLHPQLRVDG